MIEMYRDSKYVTHFRINHCHGCSCKGQRTVTLHMCTLISNVTVQSMYVMMKTVVLVAYNMYQVHKCHVCCCCLCVDALITVYVVMFTLWDVIGLRRGQGPINTGIREV